MIWFFFFVFIWFYIYLHSLSDVFEDFIDNSIPLKYEYFPLLNSIDVPNTYTSCSIACSCLYLPEMYYLRVTIAIEVMPSPI